MLAVPCCICLFVAAAIFVAWRRRPDALHARTWAGAFALAGVGWAAALATIGENGLVAGPGVTAQLAWLAAGLCMVHGLRQRDHRIDRGPVLAAIWAGIAVAGALLLDLAPPPALAGAGAALLDATGLLIGAVAIGPRRARSRPIDWSSVAVLLLLAVSHLLLAAVLVLWRLDRLTVDLLAVGSSLIYVGVGLGAMLLITGDLALALERVARTDPLTGVWNRRGFDEGAPVLLGQTAGLPAAVAIADLDAFKAVNDRHGHLVGDRVLARFAEQLRPAARRHDLLARLGGEEFVLLATDCDAFTLARRLEAVRETMARPAAATSLLPSVTTSFGVATIPPGTTLREAMERADRALYRAKQDGRNRTVVADEAA